MTRAGVVVVYRGERGWFVDCPRCGALPLFYATEREAWRAADEHDLPCDFEASQQTGVTTADH